MVHSIDWMKQNFGAYIDGSIAAGSQRFTLGNATVLLMSATPADSLDVELVVCEHDPEIQFEAEADREWRQYEAAVLKEITPATGPNSGMPYDSFKASPTEIRLPIKDFPITRIAYTKLRYSHVRSFHTLLTKNPAFWASLARHADYTPDAPVRPGILAVHLFLISEPDDGMPCVILAQRTNRQSGTVGYHGGNWSASFEEQLQFGPDHSLADTTLERAAIRALQEELLGPLADEVQLSVMALALERNILNLAGVVACRTRLSFAKIHHAWSGAEDRDEHSQIIGLPLTLAHVQTCIRHNAIPPELRQDCLVAPDFQSVFEHNANWGLHPTSALRLALAYYLVAGQ